MARTLIREVDDIARGRQADAVRRERRVRRGVLTGVVVAVVGAAAAVVVSVDAAGVRSEEVAAKVAPEVIRQVIADSRAQRARNARTVLEAANTVLVERRLPTVADPGPEANAEQLLAAASSAQVLSVLPEDVAQALRDQTPPGQVLVLPSAAAFPVPDVEGQAPGVVVPVPGTGTAPGPAPGQTVAPGPPVAGPGAPARPPARPPPTTTRRLLPQLLPLPIPLIGT